MPSLIRLTRAAAMVVSLAMLLVLACGYVCRIGFEHHSAISSSSKTAWHMDAVALEEGRVAWWSVTSDLAPPAGRGVRVVAKLRPVPLSRLGRALWEFDAHAFPQTVATGSAYIVAFPIWCAALPWLIAPGLWLWRRRRQRDVARGFDVVESSPAPAALV